MYFGGVVLNCMKCNVEEWFNRLNFYKIGVLLEFINVVWCYIEYGVDC